MWRMHAEVCRITVARELKMERVTISSKVDIYQRSSPEDFEGETGLTGVKHQIEPVRTNGGAEKKRQ